MRSAERHSTIYWNVILGIDNQPSMLAGAVPMVLTMIRPGLRFETGYQVFLVGEWDLILAMPPCIEVKTASLQIGRTIIIASDKVYPHLRESSDAVVEWITGTVLDPYFDRLGGGRKEEFVVQIRRKTYAAFPDRPLFYPFKSTYLSARRTA
jgi:hypothetical protein